MLKKLGLHCLQFAIFASVAISIFLLNARDHVVSEGSIAPWFLGASAAWGIPALGSWLLRRKKTASLAR